MGKIQVDMLGTSFTIRAKEDDEYLEKLYSYYSEITNTIKVNKNIDNPLQVSILAGITLVDELLKEKAQNIVNKEAELNRDKFKMAEKMTAEMIDKIDQVL